MPFFLATESPSGKETTQLHSGSLTTASDELNTLSTARERLLEALTGLELESAWNAIIDCWDAASDAQAMAARHFIGTVRDRVAEGLADTEDDTEFQTAALLVFTRLKAFWFELNSRLGHHLDAENADAALPLRAGLVAALLNAIEPHLPARAVEKVDAFLSAVVADEVENDAPMSGGLLPGPAAVRQKIVNILGTIEDLSLRVVQQEGELIELRTGNQLFEQAFGTSISIREAAAQMKTLAAKVNGLEAQAGMEEIYQNVLGQALGTTDPLEVVKEVRALRESAKIAQNEVFQSRLETERATERFGAVSPGAALERLRDAERGVVAALDENNALQSRLAAQAERAEAMTRERDALLSLLQATDVESAAITVRTLHENAAAYHEIAGLLGNVGKQLSGL